MPKLTDAQAAKFAEALYLAGQAHEFAKDATYLARKSAFMSKKAYVIMKGLEFKWVTPDGDAKEGVK